MTGRSDGGRNDTSRSDNGGFDRKTGSRTLPAEGTTTGDNSGSKVDNKNSNYNFRKCFNCNLTTHLARECKPRKKIVCYLCKREGHIASRCFRKNNNNKEVNSEVDIVSGQIESGSVEKFIRKVRVGEVLLTAFVDMGASVNTIKATIVLREGWIMQREKSLICGFGMGETESPGTITQTIEFAHLKPRLITFRVVPDTAQHIDIILGRPFTKAPDLGYTRIQTLEMRAGYR